MSLPEDHTQDFRGAVMRGLVLAVDDTGEMQMVDVQTHDGAIRARIEVYQPFGFASGPVAIGSAVLLLAIGGDPGDLVALPAITPSARLGNCAPGQTVLYALGGSQVSLTPSGAVIIAGATKIFLQAPQGVEVDGDLTATGNISDATRSMAADRVLYDEHTHPNGAGSPPTPQQ